MCTNLAIERGPHFAEIKNQLRISLTHKNPKGSMTGWWFGTMEFYDFPFSWEFHHPNWRTHIFQRGRSTTNQMTFHDFPWFSYGWVVGFLRTVPCSCCSHRFLLVVAICFVDPNSGWVGQPAYWLIARFCQWRACFLWGEIRFLLSRNPIFLLSRNLNGPLILMFFPGENATVFLYPLWFFNENSILSS